MKRFFLSFVFVLFAVIAFSQTENYKLGDFNLSTVKAKYLNLGGSWTIKKSSTTAAMQFYYGAAVKYTLGTTGIFDATGVTTSYVTIDEGAATDTSTAVVGKIVFIAEDSSFYGCRTTLGDHKWWKLND